MVPDFLMVPDFFMVPDFLMGFLNFLMGFLNFFKVGTITFQGVLEYLSLAFIRLFMHKKN